MTDPCGMTFAENFLGELQKTPHAVIPQGSVTLKVNNSMNRYYVYIITNALKTVLYTGMTNNWQRRINEHIEDGETLKKTFAGKYNCRYLLVLEEYQFPQDAINREKEIKSWSRKLKEDLINQTNPNWTFLNL